ncbi:TonB-dependent receptor [Chitinophaga deserti]|uniref:TonB-dependent receptor n=1 Tax=Chitinophaga deserti TaxID=2164099 RepID=UPI001E45F3B7|nr:TonB-dependent receptor [Chitinophaga deserti]
MKHIYSMMFAGLLLSQASVAQQITYLSASGSSTAVKAVTSEEDPENLPKGFVKGIVATADGKPAGFVTIVVRGQNKGTTTEEDGTFSLRNLKPGTYTLYISSVGLKPVEKQITISAEEGLEISITLEETAKQLSEVVVTDKRTQNDKPVTISKLPIPVMDLPQAVAVIGQATIREQQAQRLSDVVKNVNGVYLASTRAGTQETFSARGYGFGSSNMFKNGSRVNSGTFPEMSSLERVEILKGSAAILYGQVAPGAVMNLVTKQPRFEGGGEISMRVGSYDLYKPAIDIYGPISGKVAYRLNGTYESANSYRDQVHSKRYYVNPSLLFKVSPRTEIVVQGDYLKHDFTPDFGVGTNNGKSIVDVPRNTFFGAPWQYANAQQYTGGVTVKHQLNDNWTLNGNVSYQKYKRDYFSVERLQFTNGKLGRPLGRQFNEEDYYSATFDVTGHLKTGSIKHTILAGIDGDRYKTGSTAFTIDATKGITYDTLSLNEPGKYPLRTDMPNAVANALTVSPVNRFGGYIQDLISISEKLKVLAGVRWSYVETSAPERTDYKTGAITKTAAARYDNAFSPRFGVVYKPIPTTAFFVSYSNSFTPNTGIDIYSAPIKPSVIDQYEAGVKNDFFGGKLSANVTVYKIKNSNLAQTAPFDKDGKDNTNTNIKTLVGGTTSNGLEIDIAGHPVAGLDVVAGYSYNDIFVSKAIGGPGNLFKGDRLVNTPHHTANASVFYTFQNTALKGLKLGVMAFYTGDRPVGWNNTTTQPDRMFNVDGYTTLDLNAGYSWKNFSLMAKVSNITNEYNFLVHENYSINPIPPTQFTATLAYRFKY